MRSILMIAAVAGFATAATATPAHHKRTADTGAAAVRELNEKSLQQASAGSTTMPSTSAAPMSDSGASAAAPMAPGGAAMPPAAPADAAPTAPTTPQ